jgi:ABC-2 type transport system permease protein
MSVALDVHAFLAACRKELRIQRRYPVQYIGLFFWPIALPGFTVLMGRTYSGNGDPQAVAAFAARAGTADFAGFVFVGYAMYMWLSLLLWGAGTSIRQEQVRGSLEAVFLTPATRLVPLFAPPIAHLPYVFFQLAVMGTAMHVLFEVPLAPESILGVLAVVIVAIPAMYAIGSLFGAAVLKLGETGPIVQMVRGMFSLACGITFPIVMLPGWAQAAAWTLPPTYVVSDIRSVLLAGTSLGAIGGHLAFLVASAVVIGAVAVVAFRLLERSARQSGMLGQY